MSITPVSNLVATASDSDTIGLAWTNSDAYSEIDIHYNKGSGWVTYASGLDGDTTSYDVDNIVSNTLYTFRLELFKTGETAVYSNTDSAAIWSDAPTETIQVSGSVVEYVTGTEYTDTVTGTVYISGAVLDAQSLKTDYAYYVGDSNGKIYQYSAAYTGDAGANIPARWESKDTDFADQNIEWADKFKTIEKIRLHYIDKTSDATVSLLISTDGGANWVSKTRSIGTGDGKGKTADFFLIKTGQIFRFAIVNASASDEFQFVGLEVFYSVGGDYFEIS
jgi:hypothetical protein